MEYEEGKCLVLSASVYSLIHDKRNHRKYKTAIPLSPAMANAMELMDIALGNDDQALLEAVVCCYPDILSERSVEEISPSSTTGISAMTVSAPDMPIRATWLELACFRLSLGCIERLLARGQLQSQPKERLGWPAGLVMWSYAESRVWLSPSRMLKALSLLHINGADFNHPDPWGRLPLSLLSRSGPPSQSMSVCARLMEMGASPPGPDVNGNDKTYRQCPVLENIRQGNLAAVACFLQMSPEDVVLSQCDAGNGPLHVLATGCMGSVEPSENIVALAGALIDRGCSPDAQNDDGQMPMDLAVGHNNLLGFGKELYRRGASLDRIGEQWPLLFSACGCPDPSTGKPTSTPSIEWVNWLISKGCDPNDRVMGRSIVHCIMQTHPRITMPAPSTRPKPYVAGVLKKIIQAGWHPLASDSASIEDMVMLASPGPTLDSENGWSRPENRARIIMLVDEAINRGWFEGPHLPGPSKEFAAFMGSRWSKRLLERDTNKVEAGETGGRRF